MHDPVNTQAQDVHQSEGRALRPSDDARVRADTMTRTVFFGVTLLPLILMAIVLVGLVIRALPMLRAYPLESLLFGTLWKPTDFLFGFAPFILGTVWVTILGVGLAVPACVLVATYLSEYAHQRTRALAKPILDVLAAIPRSSMGCGGFWQSCLLSNTSSPPPPNHI